MKDLRPVYFHECVQRLVSNRLAVYDELLAAGPCTGTELSRVIGWPVTSIRPRLTELRESYWVFETGIRRNGEHEFHARTKDQVQDHLQFLHDQAAALQAEADQVFQEDQHLADLVTEERNQMLAEGQQEEFAL